MFGRDRKSNKIESRPYGNKVSQGHMFELMKRTFDESEWKYSAKPEDFAILTSFMGNDLPINIIISVREQSFHITCLLDVEAPIDKYSEICWNLNEINHNLAFGSFNLDSENGKMLFEYGMVFVESNMSTDLLREIIRMIVNTVDEHDGDLKKITERPSSMGPMYG